MNDKDKKDFIVQITDSLKESILLEEKIVFDQSQFINWMIGLASATFLLLFSNLDKIFNLNTDKVFTHNILIVAVVSFILIIILGVLYKFLKNKRLSAYMFRNIFLGLQQAHLIKKISSVTLNDDDWLTYNDLYNLKGLPKGKEEMVKKNISMRFFSTISNWVFHVTVIFFIMEFFCFFTLFFSAINN
jgi:hypothetical protein